MKYYKNTQGEVYAYETEEERQEWGSPNLVEMTEEQFVDYRDNRPKGGRWTYQGWIVDDDLLAQEEAEEKKRQIQQLHENLDKVDRDIARLERIRDRTKEEDQELEKLYDESTELYREIKSLEA